MFKRLACVFASVVLVAALSACGGTAGAEKTVTVQQVPASTPAPATVTVAPPVTVTAAPAATTTDDNSSDVPDLTGLRLDVAESDLDSMGISYQEVGGGAFGIVVRSNWTVCQQDPDAGSTATSVKLIVDREC